MALLFIVLTLSWNMIDVCFSSLSISSLNWLIANDTITRNLRKMLSVIWLVFLCDMMIQLVFVFSYAPLVVWYIELSCLVIHDLRLWLFTVCIILCFWIYILLATLLVIGNPCGTMVTNLPITCLELLDLEDIHIKSAFLFF